MSLLNTMLNDNSLEAAKLGKVVYLDIDEITPNPLNTAPINDIDILAENIADGGLMQPLIVIKKGDKNYIHSGHRRFEAIKLVMKRDGFIKYMGKQIDNVPCIFIKEDYQNDLEEKVSMMRSNSYRVNLDPKEKTKLVLEALECFEKLRELNKVSGRSREWIANVTGISERTIQNIITELKEKKVALSKEDDKDETIIFDDSEEKQAKKLIKLIHKVTDELEKGIDINLLDDKLRKNLANAKLKLSDVLMGYNPKK